MSDKQPQLSREDWLKERRGGIGGSDIGVIMGVNTYKTPYELWLEKTGRQTSNIDNRFIQLGNLLEPFIGKCFSEDNGLRIMEPEQKIFTSEKSSILKASPDYLYVGEDGWLGVLECKAVVSAGRTIQRFDEQDDAHYCQLMWYLGVLGHGEGYVAYLKGGESLYFRHDFHQGYFEGMAVEAEKWWDAHVVTDTPPPLTTLDDVKSRWPGHVESKKVQADQELTTKLLSYFALKQREKALREELETLELGIKTRIEDAEALVDEDGDLLATYKKNADGVTLDSKRLKEELPDIYKQYLTVRKGPRVMRLKQKTIGKYQERGL